MSSSTSAPMLTTLRETASVLRARGYTLRDLEEERELVQRRTAPCVLISSCFLFRLWIQALTTNDFGLLLLCMILTNWTCQFVSYARDHEEELSGLISEWDDDETGFDGGGLGEEEMTRLRRMSFQSQLAVAILNSMEGGYGYPGGEEGGRGVGDDAKSRWDRFEYESSSSAASLPGNETENDDDEPQCCSICLCEYEQGDKLVSLPCKHVFHDDCITSWTEQNIRCPLCNADLE